MAQRQATGSCVTTPTIDQIKAYAKRISKGAGLNANAAREAAATHFGFRNFADAQRQLEAKASHDPSRQDDHR